MQEFNIATIKGGEKVTGISLIIDDYKVILHDAIDSEKVTITDYIYGIEICEADTIKQVFEKAKVNLKKLTNTEYNAQMKDILTDNEIEFPVNEA